MDYEDNNVCPICHNESLYVECSLGEWIIGCEECGIDTGPCNSYEDADEKWNRMMKERVSFITRVN